MDHSIELVANGFDFPEGPCFDAAGDLYFTQCGNGWITRVSGGQVENYVNTDGTPNGAAFDEENVLWIAEAGLHKLMRYDGEELVEIAGEWDGEPLQAPNDLVFHPDGSIYMTGPGGSNAEMPAGVIYHAQRDGALEVVAEGMCFPNGLALTADAQRLYVAETSAHRILVFGVRDDGGLDGPAEFAPTPDGVGGDGMALDVDGNLYVAHFGAGEIKVFSPDGELIEQLPAGGEKPTNVAFGGPEMDELYVTEVESGAVYRLRPGIPGLNPFCDPR
ncbi:MAG: SMP-30/gluconolactonase/LRE family protein [Armatimonadota bacterium]